MRKWILGFLGLITVFILSLVGMIAFSLRGTRAMEAKSVLSQDAIQLKAGFVSVGMIQSGPSELILVDCGNDSASTEILTELKQRGLGPESVKTILITHGHPDHFNGCSSFPKAAIYAMESERSLLEGRVGGRSLMAKIMPKKPAPFLVSRYLKDGESFRIGTQSVSAFLIPGHTDGSAAYLIQGVLYLGDSADASTEMTVRPAKKLFSNDPEQNQLSLRELAKRLVPRMSEIKVLEFAHSAPLQGFQPLLDF